MKFGPVPPEDALGAVLAHSLVLPGRRIGKGTVLDAGDIAAIRAAGLDRITVARLDPGDVDEDRAARRIGAVLAAPGLAPGMAGAGRVNLISAHPGLVFVDAARVEALNAVDEGLTLATLGDGTRVGADQLVATVKVIPYALPEAVVVAGEAALAAGAIRLAPFRSGSVRLILTRTPGFKTSLLAKGEAVVRARVEALGMTLSRVDTVAHEEGAVARCLADGGGEAMALILGASATSDRGDVAPSALVRAGGRITRFGMPVDPGNLLFLGELRGAPVVGLPGCARSPALNGVDWVLERLAAGVGVTARDIARMGVGGLLKEMPERPQPRRG